MLVNPRKFYYDPTILMLNELIGQGGKPALIEDGIFFSPSFNMEHFVVDEKEPYYLFVDDSGKFYSPYGVCDTIQQIKDKYAKWFNDENLKFFVSVTPVYKSEQPESGGWRWHKWGDYIGEKERKHEYLYDEDDTIQEVLVYHIFQLL